MATLNDTLKQIFADAIDARWSEVEPFVRAMAKEDLVFYNNRLRDFTAVAAAQAFDAAVKRHMTTTFAPVVDAMAREHARATLAKRLNARGMSADVLDTIGN